MKNSNYSPHRGIVRVFGKRATKQNGNGEPFYLQKHPLKKQPSGKEICCRGKKIKRGCEKLESEVP